MKKFIYSSLLSIISLLAFAITEANAQTSFVQQSQMFTGTLTATIQPTVPESSFYGTHTLNWSITGTVVGTAQIQACTTTLTTSCANMTGSTSVNLASSGSYTLEGQTTAFGAFTITISTCTSCTITITYTATNPNILIANLQDGFWNVPLGQCGVALTTGAYAANPANSGALSAPSMVRVASGQQMLQVTTTAAASALTVDCDLTPPSRLTTGKGVTITGFIFYYGNQTSALTSITTPVVNTILWPVPPSATPVGTVATAGGTITLSPVSPTLTTTTLGQCNAFQATFATPVVLNNSSQKLETTVVLNQTVAAATVYQVCAVDVLYQNNPL